VGIEHVPIIVGLRRGAVNTGAWEDDHGAKLFLALERGSNALGMSAASATSLSRRMALPIFDGTQEYCLWLGCMGGTIPRAARLLPALCARDANYLGASFGVLRKEKCTGDPVRRLGNDLLFQQLAEANLEALAQNKVKKIVSICPHCVRTIQEDWKEYGTPPEVEHHSEFLARFARSCQLSAQTKTRRRSSSTIRAIWAAIATSTTSRERVAALAESWSKRRARMSAVSAAAQAEGWRFSARRPASA
jgi:Fe-S oxidoreductase